MNSSNINDTYHNFIFNFPNFLIQLEKPCFIWPLWHLEASLCNFLPYPLQPTVSSSLCQALSSLGALAGIVSPSGKGLFWASSMDMLLTPQPQHCCPSLSEALFTSLSNSRGHLCYSLWWLLFGSSLYFPQFVVISFVYLSISFSLLSSSQHATSH